MKTTDTRHNDTRLLFGVAGAVVAGVLGIVLLAGLASREETPATAAKAGPAASEPGRPAAALPASFERAASSRPVVEPLEPTPSAEPVERAEPDGEIVIDPDADPVAAGLAAWGEHDYALAAAYFRAAADARPGRAWTHYILGLSLWKSGEGEAAVDALEEARRLDPDAVKTLVNLSRVQNDLGRFDDALISARAAIAADGDSAEARFLEGRSLRNLSRSAEARQALRASVELDPDNGYARNLLGLALLESARAAEAVVELERATELEPDVAYIRNNLGMALEHDGRRVEALAAYRAAREIDPGHASATANAERLAAILPPESRAVDTAAVEPTPSADAGL